MWFTVVWCKRDDNTDCTNVDDLKDADICNMMMMIVRVLLLCDNPITSLYHDNDVIYNFYNDSRSNVLKQDECDNLNDLNG